ncbi:T-cell surface antigen CD2 isoform X4 [Betta splendens]|uniref:T-cell surface antigen CD2 isoform X4 n=1 Tax=Betta splendens TaxID=158456 RepID=A0A6P7NQV1_BETSP|nr:T-cell surface antigen CD2 isoform X4 [Betta splendens]
MEAVVGLMVVLLGRCYGVETYCDGRQNETQCYGALGGTVDVQLMDRASDVHRYQWIKGQRTILNGNKNGIVTDLTDQRYSFTLSNGTFRINNLSRNDGGEYQLELYDSEGKNKKRTLHLTIQAPVGSVLLLSECLSEGQMRASCSSEGGDSPQYSWTLDGHTLTHAELLSGNNETNNITLKQHVSGRLLCSVRNQVNNVSKEETITDCGFIFINCTSSNGTRISQWVFAANNTLCVKPTTHPTTVSATTEGDILYTAAGVLSALICLLVVGVVVCAQMKKKGNKPKAQNHEEELTYADVRIMQRQRTQPQQKEEVEYGQVRFSARPQQSVAPAPAPATAPAEDCVYAKVCRDR